VVKQKNERLKNYGGNNHISVQHRKEGGGSEGHAQRSGGREETGALEKLVGCKKVMGDTQKAPNVVIRRETPKKGDEQGKVQAYLEIKKKKTKNSPTTNVTKTADRAFLKKERKRGTGRETI